MAKRQKLNLPHRKRSPEETVNRLWTDDELMDMIDQINMGYTYQDVTRGKQVPISTLWTRVKGKYQGEVRPKTGSPGIFPPDMEADLALFIKHCEFLRIPRTHNDLKEDIWHYVEYNNLHFKRLTEDGPGRTWQDRFAADWSDLVDFKMKGIAFRIQNDPITMKMWVHEHDNYTKIQKMTKEFPSKDYIFVVEANKLEISATNSVQVEVLLLYNANGDILKPFIGHKGEIVNAVQNYFKEDMIFCKTSDGKFCQSVLVELFKSVQRHLARNGLHESAVIYLSPPVSKYAGFTLWQLCNQYQYIMQTIPQNIYNYLRTADMGIFRKIWPAFHSAVEHEYPQDVGNVTYFKLLEILNKIIQESRWSSHLRNTCRRLRIVAITRDADGNLDDDEQDDLVKVTAEEGVDRQDAQLDSTINSAHEDVFDGSELQQVMVVQGNVAADKVDPADDEHLPDIDN